MAYNLSNLIPVKFSTKLIKRFWETTIWRDIANTDYEGEIKQGGDQVYIRTVADVINLENYTKGQTSLTPQDLAPAKEALVVDQQKYFKFVVDDIDKFQSDINVINEYVEEARKSIDATINRYVLSLYDEVHDDNKITNSGSAIAVNKDTIYRYIVQAKINLDKKEIPLTDRFFVFPPDAQLALLNSGALTPAVAVAYEEVVLKGLVGTVAGFKIYINNGVSGNNTNGYYCLYGHKSAICMAVQILDVSVVPSSSDPNSFLNTCKGLVVYGAKVPTERKKALGYLFAKFSVS